MEGKTSDKIRLKDWCLRNTECLLFPSCVLSLELGGKKVNILRGRNKCYQSYTKCIKESVLLIHMTVCFDTF